MAWQPDINPSFEQMLDFRYFFTCLRLLVPSPLFSTQFDTDDAPIYHSQRWGEAKLAHEHSFRRRSRKTNFLLPHLRKWIANSDLRGE